MGEVTPWGSEVAEACPAPPLGFVTNLLPRPLEPHRAQTVPGLRHADVAVGGPRLSQIGSVGSQDIMPDLVLKDVHVGHTEEQVASLLAEQGYVASSVTRFHRTARGKPPKTLPLCRITLDEESASRLLAAKGAHLAGVYCAAGLPHSDKESAAARGWSAESSQHRGRKVESPAPRTAPEAVAPLQDVPYTEQLQRKRQGLMAELAKLPSLMWKEAASVGAAQRPAWDALAWLRAEELERRGGAPCEVEAVVPSPLTEGYRNKCMPLWGLEPLD